MAVYQTNLQIGLGLANISTLPASTSCITAWAVNDLMSEPIKKGGLASILGRLLYCEMWGIKRKNLSI
jgi:hypothetical protein